MNLATAAALAVAGFAAGAINTVVGGGSLITFPVLLAAGYPSLTANISNNVAMVVGNVSGTWGTRAELAGHRRIATRLLPASALSGAGGAVLLLVLPPETFRRVVPVLVMLGVILIVVQPWLSARLRARGAGQLTGVLWPGVALTGLYGGYFGAAQGVLLIAVLGIATTLALPTVNALKNVLALAVNACATVVFAVLQPHRIDPLVVAVVAFGAVLGGWLGARTARRLPTRWLRAVIVLAGLAAVLRLIGTTT